MGVVSEARIRLYFLFESVYKISSTFGKGGGRGRARQEEM
jgi:hypothetical protein